MIPLDTKKSLRVLGFGAYLKNRSCLFKDGEFYWSESHGDLSDPIACKALAESIEKLTCICDQPLDLLVHDMHPDFYSTVLATRLSNSKGIPCIGVQHHHAHIAAVIAEHGIKGGVLGLALDGAGWGMDGTVWGGELLHVDQFKFKRLGRLAQLTLPGGDLAAKQPWRMAASALNLIGRAQEITTRLSARVGANNAELIKTLIDKGIGSPLSSSAGRWFDVAAGLLGICDFQTYDAQAAQMLEQAAQRWLIQYPNMRAAGSAVISDELILDLSPLITGLLDVKAAEIDRAAAQFHLELIDGLARLVLRARDSYPGINQICLSGGCFHNTILKERLTLALESSKLEVYLPSEDCGDAGLAAGQVWVGVQYLRNCVNIH